MSQQKAMALDHQDMRALKKLAEWLYNPKDEFMGFIKQSAQGFLNFPEDKKLAADFYNQLSNLLSYINLNQSLCHLTRRTTNVPAPKYVLKHTAFVLDPALSLIHI